MPIYQYVCPKCHAQFERRQSFADESVVACPRCNNGARRLFSPVPIIFKGSGFYVTDSNARKSGLQNSAQEDNGDKPEAKGTIQNDGKADKKEDKAGNGEAEK